LSSKTDNWFVAISNHNKITSDFKETLSWPKTKGQIKIENEILENVEEKICSYCMESYTGKTNKIGSCMMHQFDYLYLDFQLNDEIEKYKKLGGKSDNYPNPIKLEFNIRRRDLLDQIESNKNKYSISSYKYVCCGKTIYEKGEIPCYHYNL